MAMRNVDRGAGCSLAAECEAAQVAAAAEG
eukprot:COSAG04_NODE_17747_length_460_cov_0.808864_1_plen_29_part_10